ncbi:class D beta-lactamase [Azospirillum sp. ST 5-10]|uniref:class D beta-lactamase n=1 Tax=unclassified Azospirillum TaxID=2630922 RepID=UPI003F4A5B3B
MRQRSAALAILAIALFARPAAAAPVCTVVADAASGTLLLEEGRCGARVTPASTFKIALSLMGYDSGVLVDGHAPALPFREGDPDWSPAWRATTDPARWMALSVVWYSQRITAALGEERFRRYVDAFGYGNGDVSGTPGGNDGLRRAWISSSLAISPLEQVRFLGRLVRRELPVGAHATAMTRRITAVGTLAGGWEVHGKTGTGAPAGRDGTLDRNRPYGWFVGWATRGERTVVFAHLIQDAARQPTLAGVRARDALMAELPRILGTP